VLRPCQQEAQVEIKPLRHDDAVHGAVADHGQARQLARAVLKERATASGRQRIGRGILVSIVGRLLGA
jgi:hypothetical protein